MKEIVKNLESTDVQMREKVTSLENKVTELEAKNPQQDSLLSDLLREKNERAAANHFESASISSNQSAVALTNAILMRGSQIEWPHPQRILFYRWILDDGIRFLRFLQTPH